ncbi:RNA polymerase sigma factor, sigma-70 family [Mariniphaga anaerophila]|uniref:RNA polymerase sigma factor, sigma-70 family n=1 Tax=Mariniphaga anaerophila TaxID=1484053 RepID=A0A1M5GBK3_9BACT|nr:sigma-70 family RNA polymerase sigma factor [Mariniphaga anaerophila]SHG01076.1 RNA polymerase sigma factor, sigma-70 family [Mariniphaga anaerophila]
MTENFGKDYWKFVWEEFKSGDRKAFEIIYKEYVEVLYSYGAKISSDRALVEDSIQDTFLAIYTWEGRLRKPESLEFFLYKTLKRILISRMKEKNRQLSSDEFAEQFDLKFLLEEADTSVLDEQTVILKRELENLDSQKRELLFLRFNSGLSYIEMGELLELKADTAKKQVTRLLKVLRKKLEQNFVELFVFCFKV